MPTKFERSRQKGVEERIAAAAERSAHREAAPPPPPSTGGWAFDTAAGGVAATVLVSGVAMAILLSPLVGALGIGLGTGLLVRAVRQAQRSKLVVGAEAGGLVDPTLRSAHAKARDALENSTVLEEGDRVELMAALEDGHQEMLRLEEDRAELLSLSASLAEFEGAEEEARITSMLGELETRAGAFAQECGKLHARVAGLALEEVAERGRAVEELRRVSGALGERVEAQREVQETLARARARREGER